MRQETFNIPGGSTIPNYQINFPIRGKVIPNSVRCVDIGEAKQLRADIYLYDIYPPLYNVPFMASKINKVNGEFCDPEGDDIVLVMFIGGDFRDPVVSGYLAPAGNEVQSQQADYPRYHRTMNGTSEKIEKSGRRVVHVAENDELEIVGSGTITVGAGITVNVTGDADITVSGAATLTADGTTINSDVQVNGTLTASGNIASTGGDVSDSSGTMQAMRDAFDPHKHSDAQGGTTGGPDTSM